jgi:hypothetical protein
MSAAFGIHSFTERMHYNANRIGKMLRTAIFWVITQRVVVIYYRRFGTTYRYHLRCYHYSLRGNPEERSSHLLRGESLKSRTKNDISVTYMSVLFKFSYTFK